MKISIIQRLYLKKVKKKIPNMEKKIGFENSQFSLIFFFNLFLFFDFITYLYTIRLNSNYYFDFGYFLVFSIFILKATKFEFFE